MREDGGEQRQSPATRKMRAIKMAMCRPTVMSTDSRPPARVERWVRTRMAPLMANIRERVVRDTKSTMSTSPVSSRGVELTRCR